MPWPCRLINESVDASLMVVIHSHSAQNLRLLCRKLFQRNQTCIEHGLEFLERSQRISSWV